MYSCNLLVCVALFFCYSLAAQPDSHEAGDFLISNVSCIDVASGTVIPAQDIFIQNGHIADITEHSGESLEEGVVHIDGTGKYLMPGISEMHAHIPTPQNGSDQNVRETLFLYLSNGITTIRGMLGDPYHLELKQQINDGTILSPRVYTSSPSLNGRTVTSREEATEKVTQYAQDGYDFLKIHPGISLPVMTELVKTAREMEIEFAGHVPADVGIRNALEFEYSSIDHVDGYVEGLTPEGTDRDQGGFFGFQFTDIADLSKLPELVALTKKHDVWIVPTQSLFTRWISPTAPEDMIQAREMSFMPASTRYSWVSRKSQVLSSDWYDQDQYQSFLELRKTVMKALYDADVPFLLGSDAPQVFNVPGFSIQHEMQAMVEAGIPPADVLRSGTVNPAKFFNAGKEFGQLIPGYAADMIMLSENPLEDISNMQTIEGVMIRGHWLSHDEIDRHLKMIADRHSE